MSNFNLFLLNFFKYYTGDPTNVFESKSQATVGAIVTIPKCISSIVEEYIGKDDFYLLFIKIFNMTDDIKIISFLCSVLEGSEKTDLIKELRSLKTPSKTREQKVIRLKLNIINIYSSCRNDLKSRYPSLKSNIMVLVNYNRPVEVTICLITSLYKIDSLKRNSGNAESISYGHLLDDISKYYGTMEGYKNERNEALLNNPYCPNIIEGFLKRSRQIEKIRIKHTVLRRKNIRNAVKRTKAICEIVVEKCQECKAKYVIVDGIKYYKNRICDCTDSD